MNNKYVSVFKYHDFLFGITYLSSQSHTKWEYFFNLDSTLKLFIFHSGFTYFIKIISVYK